MLMDVSRLKEHVNKAFDSLKKKNGGYFRKCMLQHTKRQVELS